MGKIVKVKNVKIEKGLWVNFTDVLREAFT